MIAASDSYGSLVIVAKNPGPSTADQGCLFGVIEGSRILYINNTKMGIFKVISDGVSLGTRMSYNSAYDLCIQYGLVPVDCT